MGTIWIFVYYAVYGSRRGRRRNFLVLKWAQSGEHMKQKELFFQYYSACVDANYIKESIKDIQQTVRTLCKACWHCFLLVYYYQAEIITRTHFAFRGNNLRLEYYMERRFENYLKLLSRYFSSRLKRNIH